MNNRATINAEPLSAESLSCEPLNAEQQTEVIHLSHDYMAQAADFYQLSCEPIPIRFDLKGQAAGVYQVVSARGSAQGRAGWFAKSASAEQRMIRYNPYIFERYYSDNLDVTVPHEVAHYVVDLIHGLKNVRPHGPEWRAVMAVFGVENVRATAAYDLTGLPLKRQRRHPYRCDCRDFELTTRRHNLLLKGSARYCCRACGAELRYQLAAP